MTEQLIYLYGKLGLHHTALDMLTDRGYTILRGADDQTDADFLRRAREAQIVVMDDHYFKEAWFDQLPQLRLIIRRGVGYDKIPIEAATKRHVWVANTPGANASSVAEIALGLMLETVRKMPAARDYLNQLTGKMYPSYLVSHSLGSRTVGLVGYGNIAKATEQMVAGFGAKILVTARHPHTPKYGQFVDLATLLAESDVVSLHLPATAETTGLFDRQLFAQMKTDAILINTSRGSLVNETDLVAAIDGGIIGGAGLDTTSMEPVPAQSPLLAHERIVLLPHIGGFTIEAEVKTAHMVAQNCIDLFEERTPRFALN